MEGHGEADIVDLLPAHFWTVRYDGEVTPKNAPARMEPRANCLVYAYAVLAHFGREVPPFWSSELWADVSCTRIVDAPEPLDLMLFATEPIAYAAHLGVYVGEDRILHLCKEVGEPIVWPLAEFASRDRYQTLVGIKRVVAYMRSGAPEHSRSALT